MLDFGQLDAGALEQLVAGVPPALDGGNGYLPPLGSLGICGSAVPDGLAVFVYDDRLGGVVARLADAPSGHLEGEHVGDAVVEEIQEHGDLAVSRVRPLEAPDGLQRLGCEFFRQRLGRGTRLFSLNALEREPASGRPGRLRVGRHGGSCCY